MKKPKVGFIVYGVHKDGLKDPMGIPFIDDKIISNAKEALINAGLDLFVHDLIIATKAEAKKALSKFKKDDSIDAIILFSGTWVWAAHLVAPIRDFSTTGKGIILWTNPGSQGWRPVGGLVLHGALKEIGINHRFAYGDFRDSKEINKIVSYCRASHEKNVLNMSTIGVWGGRGMGQTCGVADPSQWMKTFGIDIDSRDTTELITTAQEVSKKEIEKTKKDVQVFFADPIPDDEVSERSIRLYIAIKKLLQKEGWDFYTIQSFPGLGDDYSATCFAQSIILNDGIGTSTLSDFNTAMTVKLLTDMSSERVYYGDLQHIDKSNKEIKIIGDGACPPSLAGKLDPARFAEHGIPTEGKAGGLSIKLTCKPGKGVLARLGRNNGKFEMPIVKCTIFEPSKKELEKRQKECGIPFWPHAFVTVHCDDIDKLIDSWNNEYAVLGYGENLYYELIDFCEITGIKPIPL